MGDDVSHLLGTRRPYHVSFYAVLSFLTLCDPVDCSPPRSSAHGDFPGTNTRVGCHPLLQGIFPTQGLNPQCKQCPTQADSLLSELPGKPITHFDPQGNFYLFHFCFTRSPLVFNFTLPALNTALIFTPQMSFPLSFTPPNNSK